jgi:hypothetical protein
MPVSAELVASAMPKSITFGYRAAAVAVFDQHISRLQIAVE